MLDGSLGSSDARLAPVRIGPPLALHILASVNRTPLPRVFGQVRAKSAPLRHWCVSAIVQPPTSAFTSRPLLDRKCCPLPNGRSYVLRKLNTFGRSNGRYDLGCVRLYMSCGYTWFCVKICRYVSNPSDLDRT